MSITEPCVDDLVNTLERTLDGARPATEPTERAVRYGGERAVDDALAAYRAAVDGTW